MPTYSTRKRFPYVFFSCTEEPHAHLLNAPFGYGLVVSVWMRFKQETKSILIHAPPYLCAPSFLRKKFSHETSPMYQESSHPNMPCPDISHRLWISIDGWIQIWMKNQPNLLQPLYLYLSSCVFDSERCKLNRDFFWACKHKRKSEKLSPWALFYMEKNSKNWEKSSREKGAQGFGWVCYPRILT